MSALPQQLRKGSANRLSSVLVWTCFACAIVARVSVRYCAEPHSRAGCQGCLGCHRCHGCSLLWTALPRTVVKTSRAALACGSLFAQHRGMTRNIRRQTSASFIAAVLLGVTLTAQTRIEPRRNSFTPAQDVQL